MKTKILFTLSLLTFSFFVFSQECTNKSGLYTIKIKVNKIIEYGIEHDPHDPGHYLLLTETQYKSEFQNIWPSSSSKSFGKISDCDFWFTENLDYGKLSFKWNYKNTYDDKEGIALVQVDIHIDKELRIAKSYVTIVGEENDFIVAYKGQIIRE